jgi:hypothetical protein
MVNVVRCGNRPLVFYGTDDVTLPEQVKIEGDSGGSWIEEVD